MTVAILQIIMINDMIKIEFKVTAGENDTTYVEKIIETREQYEMFKQEIATGFEILDDLVNLKLDKNGQKTDHVEHHADVEHNRIAV